MRANQYYRALSRGVAPSSILTDLVEYWKFDSNTIGEFGSTQSAAVNITIDGGGKINSCALATASGVLTFPDDDRFSFTNGTNDLPFSISFWVNVSSWSTAGNWIFSKREQTAAQGEYQFYIDDNTGTFRVSLFSELGAVAQIGRISTTSLSLSTWYHIAITYNGSGVSTGIKIYINGVEETTTNLSSGTYIKMLNGTATPNLFRLGTNNNTVHKGKIDEFAIWKNRELISSDITQLYNSGSGLQYPF